MIKNILPLVAASMVWNETQWNPYRRNSISNAEFQKKAKRLAKKKAAKKARKRNRK